MVFDGGILPELPGLQGHVEIEHAQCFVVEIVHGNVKIFRQDTAVFISGHFPVNRQETGFGVTFLHVFIQKTSFQQGKERCGEVRFQCLKVRLQRLKVRLQCRKVWLQRLKVRLQRGKVWLQRLKVRLQRGIDLAADVFAVCPFLPKSLSSEHFYHCQSPCVCVHPRHDGRAIGLLFGTVGRGISGREVINLFSEGAHCFGKSEVRNFGIPAAG